MTSHITTFITLNLCPGWLFQRRVRKAIRRLARRREAYEQQLRLEMAQDIKKAYQG